MPAAPDLPVPMRALLAGARRKQSALLDLICTLVLAESPSDDKTAVDACVALAAAHAKGLGGHVKLHKQSAFGNVLEARLGPRSKTGAAGRVLLLAIWTQSGRWAPSSECPAVWGKDACGVRVRWI